MLSSFSQGAEWCRGFLWTILIVCIAVYCYLLYTRRKNWIKLLASVWIFLAVLSAFRFRFFLYIHLFSAIVPACSLVHVLVVFHDLRTYTYFFLLLMRLFCVTMYRIYMNGNVCVCGLYFDFHFVSNFEIKCYCYHRYLIFQSQPIYTQPRVKILFLFFIIASYLFLLNWCCCCFLSFVFFSSFFLVDIFHAQCVNLSNWTSQQWWFSFFIHRSHMK